MHWGGKAVLLYLAERRDKLAFKLEDYHLCPTGISGVQVHALPCWYDGWLPSHHLPWESVTPQAAEAERQGFAPGTLFLEAPGPYPHPLQKLAQLTVAPV